MNIVINGTSYLVPAEEEVILLRQVEAMVLEEYQKLSMEMHLLGKIPAREILRKMENTARAKHGNEKAMFFRPAKKADPCIHLAGVMLEILQEAMKHVTVSIGTESDTIAALGVSIEGKGQGGRPLVTDGNVGEREDNSAQIS